MTQLDNTLKYNRTKQIVYWNLITLNNLHSLSQAIVHHPFPQLHTDKDRDWRDLFFLRKPYTKGQQMKQSFLSRSLRYVFSDSTALNRVQLYKSYYHDLSVTKHQFWTRLYNLKPNNRQDYQCRTIVRNIVWKERLVPYLSAITMSIIFNKISGIAKLKFSSQVVTSILLLIISELVVKVKKSDKIFYQLPVLPNPELQSQRIKILQQSIIVDGKINLYDIASKMDEKIMEIALKQNQDQKKQILQALGYRVITKNDLI